MCCDVMCVCVLTIDNSSVLIMNIELVMAEQLLLEGMQTRVHLSLCSQVRLFISQSANNLGLGVTVFDALFHQHCPLIYTDLTAILIFTTHT